MSEFFVDSQAREAASIRLDTARDALLYIENRTEIDNQVLLLVETAKRLIDNA